MHGFALFRLRCFWVPATGPTMAMASADARALRSVDRALGTSTVEHYLVLFQGEPRRHQPDQATHTPRYVVDAAALPALEVVVMPLARSLVAHGLACERHRADAALVCQLLQRAVHGRNAERRCLAGGQFERLLG